MTDPLLDRLTPAERASLTSGTSLWCTQPIDRAGIPAVRFSDGPHGLRRQPTDGDYLGTGQSRPATCFPPAVALGSSWDPDLLGRVGAAIGREARAMDVDVLLGPGINIKRSPLCGRNFEYLSEDPHLAGRLAAAFIQGVQSQGVGAALKHFAVNNQETDRLRISAEVDERTLREIYLAGFEYAVTNAQPWTVMCSYNRVNGVYASEHHWLLTEVLRGEWGFDGVVISDWGAVNDRVAALRAGLDLEMPTSGGASDAELLAAVESGGLDQALVDRAARRVLGLVHRAGGATAPDGAGVDPDHQHRLARQVAAECAVLLKNDGVLPLRRDGSVAVVGELARTPRFQGAGSSQIVPTKVDQPLTELRALAGGAVPFAPGYRLDTDEPAPRLVDEARSVAAAAEVTVVFLGLPAEAESEGYDRTHLDLPASQRDVLAAVAGTGTRVVAVLSNGGVVRVSEWGHSAAAIVEGWLLGQAGGGAIADLLFGVVNPSGRLAETIPVRLADTASYLNFPGELGRVRYGEGVFVGYRHHDAVEGEVSYPFGHGLSYTSFDYTDLAVTTRGQDESIQVEVTARITNTGDRAGQEVAQLYVSAPRRTVRRPPRELRGFAKVRLAPGETATVQFTLGWRDFAHYHVGCGRWAVEPGEAGIHLGASSRDIRLTGAARLAVTESPAPLTPDSPLAEWAAVPGGLAALVREMRPPAGSGLSGSRFLTEQSLRTMGAIPLRRLARFPGAYLDPDRLPALAAELNGRTGAEP